MITTYRTIPPFPLSQENARGRFLKVSETFTRGYSRFQIFIPADGMEEFHHHLKDLIDEYDDGGAAEIAGDGEGGMVMGGGGGGGAGTTDNRWVYSLCSRCHSTRSMQSLTF